jgi:DNA modification methylase
MAGACDGEETMSHYQDEWLQVYEGDCSQVMRTLPEESVHTIITSPPYYGLRDYGHEGQLGQEDTPDEYVEHLRQVFSEARRVLRRDGLLWLNLGDSYAAGGRGAGSSKQPSNKGSLLPPKRAPAGYKPKDLLGIPWQVALALRGDGWYLRRDIIWNKPNPMPESIDDRPTSSHEYVFMLAKSRDYFYDAHAVKEPISEAMAAAIARGPRPDRQYQHDEHNRNGKRSGNRAFSDPASLSRIALGRNRRSVWTIPTVSYPGAHYATFPPKLVEPMIMASTSEHGVCEECGAQWARQVKVTRMDHHETTKDGKTADGPYAAQSAIRNGAYVDTETTGWEPTCSHSGDPRPAVVLDPFAGSGTVGVVANRLSRRAVLIDINAEYLKLQMERNSAVPLGL